MGLIADIEADGQAAVDRARSQHYDLILMDVQMPVLDGIQAARLIRRAPGHRATPIVALAEDHKACIDAGMNEVLIKPIDPAALFAALLGLLRPGPDTPTAAAPGQGHASPPTGAQPPGPASAGGSASAR